MVSENSYQVRTCLQKCHRLLHHLHTDKQKSKTEQTYTYVLVSLSGAENTYSCSYYCAKISNIGNFESNELRCNGRSDICSQYNPDCLHQGHKSGINKADDHYGCGTAALQNTGHDCSHEKPLYRGSGKRAC